MAVDKKEKNTRQVHNYQALGFMCGIEIHQQLSTGKLFSRTPSQIIDEEECEYTVQRYLRASAGEHGSIDLAAQKEQDKKKKFSYEGFIKHISLVELDDEPPRPMDHNALVTALQVAKLCDAHVVDQIHTMRKIVVDGSNTSGFQRTALIATGGKVLDVAVDTLCLEEDSCRNMGEDKHTQTKHYRLDRLGIPLIEIATAPEITSASHAKDIAAHIGMMLRSTGKAKRGLGTIRQDLNVSIHGGNRVEIKGAQDLRMIETWIDEEISRQLALEALAAKTRDLCSELVFEPQDLSTLFLHCESKIVKKVLEQEGVIMGLKLAGFAGLLGQELQTARRFGTELSDYAKAASGLGGMFHSDELPKYGIEQKHVDAVKKALACNDAKNDAFILFCGAKHKVELSLQAAFERAQRAHEGVISEVRKTNPNGSSSYLRPMPGASRMYPETDIDVKTTKNIEFTTPRLLTERAQDIAALGVSKDVALTLVKSEYITIFEKLQEQFPKIKASFLVETLIGTIAEIEKKEKISLSVDDEVLLEIFAALDANTITKQDIPTLLLAAHKKEDIASVIEKIAASHISDEELKKIIQAVLDEHAGAPFGKLMGRTMAALQGKGTVDGAKVKEFLQSMSK